MVCCISTRPKHRPQLAEQFKINCSIPEGNINAYTLREYINNHSTLKYHIYVVYDKLKNIFEFQKISNNSLQLQIINVHSLLGFSKDEKLLDLPCVSSKPVNVMSITNVFLHLEPGSNSQPSTRPGA